MNAGAEALKVNGRETTSANAAPRCSHASARHIRLYVPYSDAAMARARIAHQPSQPLHVSKLYAIPGGWGWTMCRDCAKG
jgi:hypothetical protein